MYWIMDRIRTVMHPAPEAHRFNFKKSIFIIYRNKLCIHLVVNASPDAEETMSFAGYLTIVICRLPNVLNFFRNLVVTLTKVGLSQRVRSFYFVLVLLVPHYPILMRLII